MGHQIIGCSAASDVLKVEWADGADREAMRVGCHYDYRAQTWVDGHDHAHFDPRHNTDSDLGSLEFCGADYVTCQGVAS